MSLTLSAALHRHPWPEWSLLLAKEPSLTGDPIMPDVDKTVVLGPSSSRNPKRPTRGRERLLFLVLLLIIVAVGGYLAVNPDVLMRLLGQAPVDTAATQPPSPPKPPAPSRPPSATPAPAGFRSPESTVSSTTSAGGLQPVPSSPTPTASAPPSNTPPSAHPGPVPPTVTPSPLTSAQPVGPPLPTVPKPVNTSSASTIPTPKFGEGEKVTVITPTPLAADPGGKKPGAVTLLPGTTLTVLDADLQNSVWVYAVRTDQGATGWVAETNLVAK